MQTPVKTPTTAAVAWDLICHITPTIMLAIACIAIVTLVVYLILWAIDGDKIPFTYVMIPEAYVVSVLGGIILTIMLSR